MHVPLLRLMPVLTYLSNIDVIELLAVSEWVAVGRRPRREGEAMLRCSNSSVNLMRSVSGYWTHC